MDLNTKGGRGKKTWAECPKCKTRKEGRQIINMYFPFNSAGFVECKLCLWFVRHREQELKDPREREAILFFESLDEETSL